MRQCDELDHNRERIGEPNTVAGKANDQLARSIERGMVE